MGLDFVLFFCFIAFLFLVGYSGLFILVGRAFFLLLLCLVSNESMSGTVTVTVTWCDDQAPLWFLQKACCLDESLEGWSQAQERCSYNPIAGLLSRHLPPTTRLQTELMLITRMRCTGSGSKIRNLSILHGMYILLDWIKDSQVPSRFSLLQGLCHNLLMVLRHYM